MNVTKHIICELTGYRPGVVDVSQGDRGSRAVSCRLLENGAPWMIPDGATVRMAYTLPDGTEGLYDALPDGSPAGEISGNTVTVELADQLMAQAGMAQMSILIIAPEGGQLATWPIRVMVSANRAARLTVPDNMPPYGAGFAGKIFFGGADGTVTPLGIGEGVEIVRQEDGSYVLVAAGGGGGGIQEEKDPTVPGWAKEHQKPTYTAQEVGAMPAGTKIPAKTSDLTNDSGFIAKSVADLVNYYTKQQTEELIAQIPKFRIVVVQQLPTMGEERVLYLVPFATDDGQYLEYIWVAGRFEVIGSQRVDLTGYATENWVAAGYQAKGDYLTEDDIGTIAAAVKKEVPLVTVAKSPIFVDSPDKMTDTGEVYVLVPDGFLWAYMAVDSVELGAELFEIGGIMGDNGTDAGVAQTQNRIRTAKLPCHTEAPISIVCNSKAKWLVHFYRDGVWLGKTSFKSTSCDDIVQLYSQPEDVTHVRLLLAYTSDANVTDIPDLLSNVTITQKVSGMAWCNTGMAYNQPVDYEDRILAMEAELEVLMNGTF